MGISEKIQVEGGLESEGKKWVITGIAVRSHLRPINTNHQWDKCTNNDEEEEEASCVTTPTGEESRIPERLPCPPAPKKNRPASKCHFTGVREIFSPPDLDSVFIRRTERAK